MNFLPPVKFGNYTRFVVMLLNTLCLTFVMANTLALNFTVLCMAEERVEYDNGTVAYSTNPKYAYSPTEKAWLFSVVAVGTLVGTFPVMRFTATIGVRNIFTIYGLITATATALLPLAASMGYGWLLAMRFFEGFSMAILFPVMGAVTSSWSSLKQSGFYMALQSLCLQFGAIFTMPVSGELCTSSLGWTSVFYIHAACTYVSFILFYIFYRNSPRKHRCVSRKELTVIHHGRSEQTNSGKQPVPYKAVMTSLPIWGVYVSYVGAGLGLNLFMQFGPTYLNKVLHYEVSNTGFAGAIPYLIACGSKILSGPISDYATCISQRARIILFTFLSQGILAVSILVMAFLPEGASTAGFVCYTLAITSSGMTSVATIKSAQLVACQHIHFVMAVCSLVNSIIILILPPFVSLLAPDNTHGQWSTIFLVSGIIVAVTNGFFIIVGRAEPAEWTKAKPTVVKNSSVYPEQVPPLVVEDMLKDLKDNEDEYAKALAAAEQAVQKTEKAIQKSLTLDKAVQVNPVVERYVQTIPIDMHDDE
uniref:MFS domain-containing protein n=1 Tax=Steinernema glaseri TaxID=37863 RepID=A0A1I8ANA5_9BILA